MEQNVPCVGAADLHLHKTMRDWANNVGNRLTCIPDVLRSVSFDDISKNDFAAVKQVPAETARPSMYRQTSWIDRS